MAMGRTQARRVLNMVGTMDEELPALSGPPKAKLATPPKVETPPATTTLTKSAPAPSKSAPAPAELSEDEKPQAPAAYKAELAWTSSRRGAAPSDVLYTSCGKCKAVYV